MSAVEVMALIGKEWVPESWNGDVWEAPDKVGDIEPQISDESPLPVEEPPSSIPSGRSSSTFEGASIALSEEAVKALPEAVVMQDSAESP